MSTGKNESESIHNKGSVDKNREVFAGIKLASRMTSTTEDKIGRQMIKVRISISPKFEGGKYF